MTLGHQTLTSSGGPRNLPWLASSFATFQEKKRRAIERGELQLPVQEDGQQQADTSSTALTTVTPSSTRASLQQVEQVVGHSALIITRPVEWGTVIFGYEQANRYSVFDQDGQPVAQLMEDYQGIGNEIGRQVLRTRRSFTATVFSADGSQIIFKLRRPMYLISSSMFIEDAEGQVLGEVKQRWHPIRRNYDLYLGNKQFASISGNFLAWEFELKDEQGGTLALVDRNFQPPRLLTWCGQPHRLLP
ncbi:Scramblase-domain-containing protein [Haematococcus lacustris]